MDVKYAITSQQDEDIKNCVIFNKTWVIASGHLIRGFLEKNQELRYREFGRQILKLLKDNNFVDISRSFARLPADISSFKVAYDDANDYTNLGKLVTCEASLQYAVRIPEVTELLQTIYNKANISYSNEQVLLKSSFLIFRTKGSTQHQKHLTNLLTKFLSIKEVQKTEDVYTISTPFSLHLLYKTLVHGKVSNRIGNSILFMSNNLVEGSEGSLILSPKMHPIGLVIHSECTLSPESSYFTVGATLFAVAEKLLSHFNVPTKELLKLDKESRLNFEKSTVFIENRDTTGTGVLVNVKGKAFLLTCSHVAGDRWKHLKCRYSNGSFQPLLLWRNPSIDIPFDIAILELPFTIDPSSLAGISSIYPKVNQIVYTSGFEVFSLLDHHTFNPSIYVGRIISRHKSLLVSDCLIQAGQSGSPMFDANGLVTGIFVANIQHNQRNVVYPNISLAIPLCEVKPILEKYVDTLDPSVFDGLIGSKELADVWNLNVRVLHSKL